MTAMDKKFDRNTVIEAIRRVPLLSPSASRLLELTADPDHDLSQTIDIVKCDAPLTAHVLRIVNSAAFGLLNKVDSIDRAVAYLGERLVISIALGDNAGALFNKPLAGYDGEKGALWRHDLLTAMASRQVSQKARVELNAGLAFTGGILHDIGKGILSDFLHDTAPELVEQLEKHAIVDYLEGERALLGIDHAEAGFEVAKCWQLPEALQMIIRYHHQPQEAPEAYRALVYAVHVGDIIAMMGGCGTGADTLQYPLDQRYSDYLDLTFDDLALILLETQEEFRRIEASFHETKEN